VPTRKYERSRWFEDFQVGERFYLPSRTLGDGLFTAFQAASGDNHPSHYDIEYCRDHGHPELLAHGFQVLIQTAPGAGDFPFLCEDSMLGFIGQSSRFLHPAYRGDTLYPELRVAALKPQRSTGVVTLASRVTNQHDTLCMEGELSFLLRRAPPEGSGPPG
jgi:acyl dehydratase